MQMIDILEHVNLVWMYLNYSYVSRYYVSCLSFDICYDKFKMDKLIRRLQIDCW